MKVRSHKDQPHAKAFIGWRVVILMAALIGLSLLIWEGAWLSGNEKITSGYLGKPKMGSTKFHVDRDNPNRKNRHSKEPVAAFFERAKRGMTEQEIRGMIADFEAIGPMPTSGDIMESRAYAEKLDDWYYSALVDALSLRDDQKIALRVSLAEKLNRRMENLKPSDSSSSAEQLNGMTIITNLDATLYLRNIVQAPWELCKLTENQCGITNKKSWQKLNDAAKNSPYAGLNWEQPWLNYNSLLMHDVVTGEIVSYPPDSNYDLRCTMYGTVKGGVLDISETFPLTPEQNLADHRNDLLAQAKLLHPAQLRMALLMNFGVVVMLKQQLEKLSE